MTSLKNMIDSISNLADKLSDLVTTINKKTSKEETNKEVEEKTNQGFNDVINNGHDTSIPDAIRKEKQKKIEELKNAQNK